MKVFINHCLYTEPIVFVVNVSGNLQGKIINIYVNVKRMVDELKVVLIFYTREFMSLLQGPLERTCKD